MANLSPSQENSLMYKIELDARRTESQKSYERLVAKAYGLNENGWLILGFVEREQCANCHHIGYDVVGKRCPHCCSLKRTGYRDTGDNK